MERKLQPCTMLVGLVGELTAADISREVDKWSHALQQILPMHPFIWSADTIMCEVEQGLHISEHDSKAQLTDLTMRSSFHTLASSIVIPTTSTLGPQTSKCNSCPPAIHRANFQPGKVYWLPASSRVLPSCSRGIPQVTSSLGTNQTCAKVWYRDYTTSCTASMFAGQTTAE